MYYLFRILTDVDVDQVQYELEKKGLKDPFIIEDDSTGEKFIGGHSKKDIESENTILVEKKQNEVNWEEQWALFAKDFKDGKAHIQLGEKTLILTPGAGFGDLSHPTTFLMIEMMKSQVVDEPVVDIGCGSGILALSALLLGAQSAIGIDIDPAAVKHARQNAKINDLNARFTKKLPKNSPKGAIFLMNMILPEQKEFNPSKLNSQAKLWLISGIMEEQREEYLKLTKTWNWALISEVQRSDWLGFTFSSAQPNKLKGNI